MNQEVQAIPEGMRCPKCGTSNFKIVPKWIYALSGISFSFIFFLIGLIFPLFLVFAVLVVAVGFVMPFLPLRQKYKCKTCGKQI